MAPSTGVVLAVAGGLGVAWLLSRQRQAGETAYDPFIGDAGGGGGGYGYEAAYAPSTVSAPGPQAQPAFSPAFERASIDLQRQAVADNRGAQWNQAASVAAGTVAFTGLAATPYVYKALSSPAVQYGLRTSPALARASAVLRTTGAVGAGLALGEAGVYALEKTGTLDALAHASASSHLPKPAVTILKTVLLPVTEVGAVTAAIGGHGSAAGNVRAAFKGTAPDHVIKWFQRRF